jgi:hypothetical protein
MRKVPELIGIPTALSLFAAYSSGDSYKKLGNSRDTTSVNKAGGPPIRDTATINKDRLDSSKSPATDSMSKGNTDPSGHMSVNL